MFSFAKHGFSMDNKLILKRFLNIIAGTTGQTKTGTGAPGLIHAWKTDNKRLELSAWI